MSENNKSESGFSLIETIVSLSLFVLAILLVMQLYSNLNKGYQAGSDRAEVTQNARVSLDRLSREVRQAVHFVGNLPVSLATASSTLEFQDGHDQSTINYIKYYLSGTNLTRETKYYYFAATPSTHVRWYDLSNGSSPTSTTTSSSVIGEYFSQLKFYGTSTGVTVNATILKNSNRYNLETNIYTRN